MARTKNFNEEEALAKALNVFWCKGFHGTSVQDLVDHMGISRASLYDTYGDKHALFMAALRKYRQQQHQKLSQALATSGSILQAIKAVLLHMTQESWQDPDKKGCFLVKATVELSNQQDTVNTLVQANEAQVEHLFVDIIRQGQQTGEIAADRDPVVLSTYLFSAIQGLRVTSLTHRHLPTLQGVVDTILSALAGKEIEN